MKKGYRKYRREQLENLVKKQLRDEIMIEFDVKVQQGIREREKKEKKAGSLLFANIRRYNETLEMFSAVTKDLDFILRRMRTKPADKNIPG